MEGKEGRRERRSSPSHLSFLPSSLNPSSPETIHSLLLNDLNLTTLFLKSLPKVYWIWTHRAWCLDNIPAGPKQVGSSSSTTAPKEAGSEETTEEAVVVEVEKEEDGTWRREAWERELKLVEKMLAVDARNCSSKRLLPSSPFFSLLFNSFSSSPSSYSNAYSPKRTYAHLFVRSPRLGLPPHRPHLPPSHLLLRSSLARLRTRLHQEEDRSQLFQLFGMASEREGAGGRGVCGWGGRDEER